MNPQVRCKVCSRLVAFNVWEPTENRAESPCLFASFAIAPAHDLTCTALHAEAYASEAYLEGEALNSADFSKQDLQYRLLVGSLRMTSSQVRGDLHTIHVHRQQIPGCEADCRCFGSS